MGGILQVGSGNLKSIHRTPDQWVRLAARRKICWR
jgi:hypothetical protein